MKKKITISETTYKHFVDCEEQLKLSREHFEAFSNQQWKQRAEDLRQLKNAEKLKLEFDKLMVTAKAFAAHKERDAETIATLTGLLKKAIAANERILASRDEKAA